MSPTKHAKNLAEPEFGRAIKIYIWEHGDIYSKCHEIYINPNHLRTFNAILTYLTNYLCPVFGAIRKLVSIKTKKCINCFKDLEHNGRYIAVGVNKCIKISSKRYRTCSEVESKITKKTVKRFYSGDIKENELRFLCETQKRNLTIIYVLMNGVTCQSPFKVVLTGREILAWDMVFTYLDSILDAPTGIQHLCTIYGDVILDLGELQHGYVYIAVPYNEKFVDMDYMSFFKDWEDDPSKKKGLLSNIRRSSRKHGKDFFCEELKNRQTNVLRKLNSSNVSCECDPGCLLDEDEDEEDEMRAVGVDRQIRKDMSDYDFSSEDDKKTVCINKNTTVVPGSEVCIFINVGGRGKYTNKCPGPQICPGPNMCPRSTNVIQCDSIENTTKAIEARQRANNDTTQTNPFYLNAPSNQQVVKRSSSNKTKTKNNVNNLDDTDYISVSVVVSKTSKITGKSNMNQNEANITLRKTCEARTFCPNITISGSFSKKVGAVTDVITKVITETYDKLSQSGISERKLEQQSQYKKICEECPFKSNTKGPKICEPNVPVDAEAGRQQSKCIKIQNRTYIDVSDFKQTDQIKDTRAIQYDKGTSSTHEPNCPYAKKAPQSDEYKCCICPTATTTGRTTTAVKSIETDKSKTSRDVPTRASDKSVQSNKPESSARKTANSKDEYNSKGSSQTSKRNQEKSKSEPENVTSVNLEVHTGGNKDKKSAQGAMSADSLSGEVLEKVVDPDGNDSVSITVSISKQNGPITEESDNNKATDVYTSTIMLDGSLTEKHEIVKSILNDIICATFEKLLLGETGEVNVDESKQLMSKKLEQGSLRDDIDTAVTTDITEKRSISSQTQKEENKNSVNQVSKSFDKTSENQKDIQISVVQPKKRSGSSKRNPNIQAEELELCENYKIKKANYDKGVLNNVYCMCEPPIKKDTGCCTCSTYSVDVQTDQREGNVSNQVRSTSSKRSRSKQGANSRPTTSPTRSRDKESMGRDSKKNEKPNGNFSYTKSTSTNTSAANTRRSRGKEVSNNESRQNNRRYDASTGRVHTEVSDASTQRKAIEIKEPESSRSKSRKMKKSNFDSDGAASDISVDSIDDNACCICVCAPEFRVQVNRPDKENQGKWTTNINSMA